MNPFIRLILFFVPILISWSTSGQPSDPPGAASIKLDLKKLNFLGSVLYVAAHPDDENTRIIAYLANGRLASTGYLAITRGDGGQNLIGPEIRDPLGLIRTQELLAARKIDKGYQFFTRASDFGYSKSAEETFKIWGKKDILSDMTRVIRQFKPDIIITRFPADSRAGHGHHTASAILAKEAFKASNDPSAFPDQVKKFGLWQTRSLYVNTGRWWNSTISRNTPGIVATDVGGYNSLLGLSYSEISAKSRTQHKSQGFGSGGRRGELLEFLESKEGYHAKKDIFENIDTTWSRVSGGQAVQPLVNQLIYEFDVENPSASVPLLLAVRKKIAALENSVWKTRKLALANQLLVNCLGLYAEVVADRYYVPPGEEVESSFELVNRSAVPVVVRKISSLELPFDSVLTTKLLQNTPLLFSHRKHLEPTLSYSNPYWLRQKHPLGRFTVVDKKDIGKPSNDPAVVYTIELEIKGEPLLLTVPLIYKWVDPVKGELWRPFGIVPPLSVQLTDPVMIFNHNKGKEVRVLLKSYSGTEKKGNLILDLPPHWKSVPTSAPFVLAGQGYEATLTFMVYPSDEEMVSSIHAVAEVGDRRYDNSLQVVDYDHIPAQMFLYPATAKVSRINLKIEGSRVGYIAGAGDKIPTALSSMGYEVWEMQNDEVTKPNLAQLDAVVLGIRAFNTNERVPFFMEALLNYVHEGGTLFVQYNTNRNLKIDEEKMAPYPFSLSRMRVTDEHSEVKMLDPTHSAFTSPNPITPEDFNNWVQERGLYFPNRWDSHFTPLLSLHDPGEPSAKGSLLVAQYGKGYYVYTGISFFRQLPEGVVGAYKLFANLLSLGKSKK